MAVARPTKPHVVQVYLTQEEHEFLKTCARQLNKTQAQALLHLAEFYARFEEYKRPAPEPRIILQGINFSSTPLQDCEEY